LVRSLAMNQRLARTAVAPSGHCERPTRGRAHGYDEVDRERMEQERRQNNL